MTRGNQRDTDRAKAQKKANASVRPLSLPPHRDSPPLILATEVEKHTVGHPISKVQGGRSGYHA